MITRLLPVAIALVACEEHAAEGVLGSPSDVKTAPGVYGGYEITDECRVASSPRVTFAKRSV